MSFFDDFLQILFIFQLSVVTNCHYEWRRLVLLDSAYSTHLLTVCILISIWHNFSHLFPLSLLFFSLFLCLFYLFTLSLSLTHSLSLSYSHSLCVCVCLSLSLLLSLSLSLLLTPLYLTPSLSLSHSLSISLTHPLSLPLYLTYSPSLSLSLSLPLSLFLSGMLLWIGASSLSLERAESSQEQDNVWVYHYTFIYLQQ